MPIRTRKALQDDSPILQLIRNEIIPYSYLYSIHDAPSSEELRARLDIGATYVAAYTATNYPYAFVHSIAQGETLYVDLLAVHPTCRKRGTGKQLMEKAEAYGAASGCTTALLYVDQSNGAALRFYENLGYRATRFAESIRCHEMIKPLGSRLLTRRSSNRRP
ncbi:GCN5-related N-acetyltransferase [Paenibacillus curdlanolyticus YK9]|uniref:GCN5-related N-acetyltransferase n=1 Tax=Paenibacillus curdlanolyticus YK9 TaxID=717606 RepID=E0I6K9_9BACL|nr:GNAT family N-acetyltransferase [Paenibacillus curdlanolyticus]EFM11675.1 GCN5-related N-acetyltransferase [Paenibacillus curdlanolyticus YK9]